MKRKKRELWMITGGNLGYDSYFDKRKDAILEEGEELVHFVERDPHTDTVVKAAIAHAHNDSPHVDTWLPLCLAVERLEKRRTKQK